MLAPKPSLLFSSSCYFLPLCRYFWRRKDAFFWANFGYRGHSAWGHLSWEAGAEILAFLYQRAFYIKEQGIKIKQVIITQPV